MAVLLGLLNSDNKSKLDYLIRTNVPLVYENVNWYAPSYRCFFDGEANYLHFIVVMDSTNQHDVLEVYVQAGNPPYIRTYFTEKTTYSACHDISVRYNNGKITQCNIHNDSADYHTVTIYNLCSYDIIYQGVPTNTDNKAEMKIYNNLCEYPITNMFAETCKYLSYSSSVGYIDYTLSYYITYLVVTNDIGSPGLGIRLPENKSFKVYIVYIMGNSLVDPLAMRIYKPNGSIYINTLVTNDIGNIAYSSSWLKFEISVLSNDYIVVKKTDETSGGSGGSGGGTSYSVATQTSDGLMSKTDKKKLDGIDTSANKYVLPAATASALGGIKIWTGTEGQYNAIITKDSNTLYCIPE